MDENNIDVEEENINEFFLDEATTSEEIQFRKELIQMAKISKRLNEIYSKYQKEKEEKSKDNNYGMPFK